MALVWKADKIELFRSLAQQGLFAKQIARAFNISVNAVYGAAGRFGVELPRQRDKPHEPKYIYSHVQVRLCFVNGCIERAKVGSFCERHAPRPTTNLKMIGGK